MRRMKTEFLLVVVGVGGAALERELQARIVVLEARDTSTHTHTHTPPSRYRSRMLSNVLESGCARMTSCALAMLQYMEEEERNIEVTKWKGASKRQGGRRPS